MPEPLDDWESIDTLLICDPDNRPTLERAVPLSLILSTESRRSYDSCPTLKIQVPAELIAQSVPPPTSDTQARDSDCAVPRSLLDLATEVP